MTNCLLLFRGTLPFMKRPLLSLPSLIGESPADISALVSVVRCFSIGKSTDCLAIAQYPLTRPSLATASTCCPQAGQLTRTHSSFTTSFPPRISLRTTKLVIHLTSKSRGIEAHFILFIPWMATIDREVVQLRRTQPLVYWALSL